jgi:hypothetical protein
VQVVGASAEDSGKQVVIACRELLWDRPEVKWEMINGGLGRA